ncbi:MAG: hypothetical protein Q4C50_10105 [Eubacteriales bacterium]|nr:hypothetical protein [Eubacteriales bacterium]
MEKIEVGRAGFDFVTCVGFYIRSENIETIRCNIKNGSFPNCLKASVSANGAVHIRETEFELRIFRSNLDANYYVQLKIYAARADGNNVVNLSMDDLKQKLEKTEQILVCKYGIALYRRNIEIHSAEINRTFVPKDEFSAYSRIFSLIAMTILQNGGKRYDVSEERLKKTFSIQGVMCEKSTYRYRIYDKAAQMAGEMDGISFDKRLMRVEIAYKGQQPLLTDFGTVLLDNWTDDMIEKAFNKRLNMIQSNICIYLEEKMKYTPGFVGRDNTVPNIIATYRKWGNVISTLCGYEANYGVPCLLDQRDMKKAIHELIKCGVLSVQDSEVYYNDFLSAYNNIPEAVTLFDEQEDLFWDFFQKAKGSSREIVKMWN